MNKYCKLLHNPKLTGKKYLCIANDNSYLEEPKEHFKINNIYLETTLDQTDENYISEHDSEILLLSEDGLSFYVDSGCFILVKKKVHPLALLEYNIN